MFQFFLKFNNPKKIVIINIFKILKTELIWPASQQKYSSMWVYLQSVNKHQDLNEITRHDCKLSLKLIFVYTQEIFFLSKRNKFCAYHNEPPKRYLRYFFLLFSWSFVWQIKVFSWRYCKLLQLSLLPREKYFCKMRNDVVFKFVLNVCIGRI